APRRGVGVGQSSAGGDAELARASRHGLVALTEPGTSTQLLQRLGQRSARRVRRRERRYERRAYVGEEALRLRGGGGQKLEREAERLGARAQRLVALLAQARVEDGSGRDRRRTAEVVRDGEGERGAAVAFALDELERRPIAEHA